MSNPKAYMLRVHDTSAAHSESSTNLEMETYCCELTLTDWEQEDTKKTRKKSDILVANCK